MPPEETPNEEKHYNLDISNGTKVIDKGGNFRVKRASGCAEEPLDQYNAPLALEAASTFGVPELVGKAMATGFSPEDIGSELLYDALFRGHTETFNALLDGGANPNQRTPDGKRSLLEEAMSLNNPDAFKTLLSKGADSNVTRSSYCR